MRNEYSLYDDICFELTNYENSTDPETTDEEWKDVFYDLLCRVANAFDNGDVRLAFKDNEQPTEDNMDQSTFKIKCTKEFELRREDIDNIMADALDGAIAYWCGSVDVVGNYLGEWASDQISRGGELVFHDIEDYDDAYTLDLDKFLAGYKMAIEKGFFSGDLENEYDGEIADIIVQCALFGEIVYG